MLQKDFLLFTKSDKDIFENMIVQSRNLQIEFKKILTIIEIYTVLQKELKKKNIIYCSIENLDQIYKEFNLFYTRMEERKIYIHGIERLHAKILKSYIIYKKKKIHNLKNKLHS